MMSRSLALLCLLFVGCATSDATRAVNVNTVADLALIDTLRELDELSDAAVGAANFQKERRELSTLADQIAHAHSRRSDEIKIWRQTNFPDAPKQIALPTCPQRDFRPQASATTADIIERLIAHRECAVSFAREALTSVGSSAARHLIEEALSAYQAELEQLRAWRQSWR